MVNMNIDWSEQNAQQSSRHAPAGESKSFFGGLFTLNGNPQEDQKHHSSRVYHPPSRPAPRRSDTSVTVLPAGVKMPTGDKPEISYGADGAKYLVIPRRSNSSTRPRQIIVTQSPSPHRVNSGGSTVRVETLPRRSSSSAQHHKSPPREQTPKLVGDPELVKQYESSQRNVARWVESVADSGSTTRRPSKRTMTR